MTRAPTGVGRFRAMSSGAPDRYAQPQPAPPQRSGEGWNSGQIALLVSVAVLALVIGGAGGVLLGRDSGSAKTTTITRNATSSVPTGTPRVTLTRRTASNGLSRPVCETGSRSSSSSTEF